MCDLASFLPLFRHFNECSDFVCFHTRNRKKGGKLMIETAKPTNKQLNLPFIPFPFLRYISDISFGLWYSYKFLQAPKCCTHLFLSRNNCGNNGGRVGLEVRAMNCLPPMWPGFDFRTRRQMGFEFVGSLLRFVRERAILFIDNSIGVKGFVFVFVFFTCLRLNY